MRALLVSLLLSPSLASAAWPEDVTLSGMTEHEGRAVFDTEILAADYESLMRELGVTVASRSVLPPETLGASGFEIAFDTTVSFIDTAEGDGNPSPWARAHGAEDPGPAAFLPGLTLRKGLPFSLEIGATAKWMGNSRQGVFGGFARAGLVEGYKPFPDVTAHIGYTGYVGNDELELGVFDIGVTLGSTFAVGPGEGARNARITPYVDVTLMTISSTPLVGGETAAAIGAVSYTSPRRNPYPDDIPSSRPLFTAQFNGGIQVVVGKVMFRVTGGYALRATGHVSSSLGLVF